jgi:hypothetical protein
MLALRLLMFLPLLLLAACSSNGQRDLRDFNSRTVGMPDGRTIRAEVVTNQLDMMRGMKYRDSLDKDRGMLFMHGQEGNFRYWMYEVKIPLDLIWLDKSKTVVQLIHNAPPCPGPEDKCPSYGGDFPAIYVLELNAGVAKQYGIKPGVKLDF